MFKLFTFFILCDWLKQYSKQQLRNITIQMFSVHELSQFDLEVNPSETLPDALEVAGNLDGLYCNLSCDWAAHSGLLLT